MPVFQLAPLRSWLDIFSLVVAGPLRSATVASSSANALNVPEIYIVLECYVVTFMSIHDRVITPGVCATTKSPPTLSAADSGGVNQILF